MLRNGSSVFAQLGSITWCFTFGTLRWWLGVFAKALKLPRRSRSKGPFAHEQGTRRAFGRVCPVNCTLTLTAALRRGASALGNVALQQSALMKTKLDYSAITTAARAAGATMVGNSFIAALLLENHNWIGIALLFGAGICVIVLSSFKGD